MLPGLLLIVKSKEIYPSHDGLYHIQRIDQFNKSIEDGQVPPRLAPSLNNSIGYPIFVANYQLPYYLSFLPAKVFSSPVFSFKIIMALSYLFSGLFAFLLFRKIGSNFSSLVAAIIYTYTPYKFANLYTRAAFGETMALIFVPLLLLSLHLISKKHKYGELTLILSFFALVTSHTIVLLVYIPLFVAYLFFIIKPTFFHLKKIAYCLMFGLFLSSFQLLPIIFEKKYLRLEETFLQVYKGHFLNLSQLLRIPLKGVNLSTPFQVGLTSSLVAIAAPIVIILNKKDRRILTLFILMILYLFLITPYSIWFWDHIKALDYVIFPWRFLSAIGLIVSILCAMFIERIRFGLWLGIILIILSMYTARHYFLRPTQITSTVPTEVPSFPNEYDTIWANKNTYIKRPTITASSPTKITTLKSADLNLSFITQSSERSDIIVRRIYFPGWRIFVDGQNTKIENVDGLISFKLPPGAHSVTVSFTESFIRLLADVMTVLSILILACWVLKLNKSTSD